MLKLFGNPYSTCTRKVLMTLAETSQPYEFTVVDLGKGEHKQPENMKHQPFGRVPAIDDDGFEMFESRAIARYLNEKGANKLTPGDAKTRAKIEQWISVETSEFSQNAMKFVYEYVMKRPQEPAVLEAAGKAIEKVCSVMEETLTKTPFLAGNEFSLADVCYMPYFEYGMTTPAKEIFAKFPHVMKWWETVSTRPTWQKVVGKA